MRLSFALLACVIACGGRAIDDGVEPGRPPADDDSADDDDSAEGGNTGDSPSETGGEPGDDPWATGGSTGHEPPLGGTTLGETGALHLVATGILTSPHSYDDTTLFYLVPQPSTTIVTAVLDGVAIKTGISGSLQLELDECAEIAPDEETCRLKVGTIGGGPAGSPQTGPLDLRLQGFGSRSDYFGTAERSGESWYAHVWPENLILDVGRWEGAIVEETYVNNELVYINVSQERAFTYPLLITELIASCVETLCDVEILAEM